MLRSISTSALVVIAITAAAPAKAGQQKLGCIGEWRGLPGGPLDTRRAEFVVTLINPMKKWVPATRTKAAHIYWSDIVVPSGANVAVRYPTGSTNRAVLAIATKNFTLTNRIMPGVRRELKSDKSWLGDCTAVATW